jgi:hypothetical protein
MIGSADCGRDDREKEGRAGNLTPSLEGRGTIARRGPGEEPADELSSEGGVSGGQGHREHSGWGLYVA